MEIEANEKEVYQQPLSFKHEALVDLTLSKSPKDSKEHEKRMNEKRNVEKRTIEKRPQEKRMNEKILEKQVRENPVS